jgi:hypothetical protein
MQDSGSADYDINRKYIGSGKRGMTAIKVPLAFVAVGRQIAWYEWPKSTGFAPK